MKNQEGFTLIELMIVVAIIAILTAIALPAYQEFVKRSKVSEAMIAIAACKTSVADYVAGHNALPTNLAMSGCHSDASQYVTSLDVTAAGAIVVTPNYLAIGIAPADRGTITLNPTTPASILTGRVEAWTCTAGLADKYVPSNCRN